MSIREELARVIARDPRYTIEAYAFVLESLNLARNRKLKAMAKRERARRRPRRGRKPRPRPSPRSRATSPAASSARPHAGWRSASSG